MDETFVNPYTFVPFPSTPPVRKRPHGHLGNPELLSGALHVTIRAEAPLLVRDIARPPDSEARPGLPTRPDGTPFLPGSSLKGALRSLHETLAGGCLRVFDTEFYPTYRDGTDQEELNKLRLAQVTQHDSPEQPPTVQLCEAKKPRQRVGQDLLRKLNSDGTLTSGQLLAIEDFDKKGLATDARRDDENGDWMLFLSDASARETKHPYRAHVGKLTSHSAEVPEWVWQRFRRTVPGTDDQRPAQLQSRGNDQKYVEVEFQYDPKQQGDAPALELGWRYVAGPRLSRGQPVWVQTDSAGRVTDLRLAMIWRHPAKETDTAGERVDPGFHPCRSAEKLCPSCRMFGSADVEGDNDAAEQNSYRGHVRFGDAHATTSVRPLEVSLPPMGAPRPGAGQFYLVNGSSVVGNSGKVPLREWGSAADAKEFRQLRGRKYYWHTPPDGQQPPTRGVARDHQNGNMRTEAMAFPAGTEFTAQLSFIDLDREQLGGLLATLRPGLLLGRDGLCHHIGGGRPLGYGTCSLSLDRAASWACYSGTRYGAPGTTVDLDDVTRFLDEFRESESSKDCLHEIGPLVATVLDPNSVDSAKVWYPPGASWSKRGEKDFDDGYDFWQQSSGAELKKDKDKNVRTGYPLIPLPDVSAPEQSLPIVQDDESVELPRQKPLPGDR